MASRSTQIICLLLLTGACWGFGYSVAEKSKLYDGKQANECIYVPQPIKNQPLFAMPVVYNEVPSKAELNEPNAQIAPGAGPLDENAPGIVPNATVSPESTNPSSQAEEFHPPFKERTDLFSPPKAGTVVQSTGSGDQIESMPAVDITLKGFARVHEPRVLIMIEDSIAPLGVGQEKLGVRVVEINPPHVTLARDDQQWTLSLSNRISDSAQPRLPRRPEAD